MKREQVFYLATSQGTISLFLWENGDISLLIDESEQYRLSTSDLHNQLLYCYPARYCASLRRVLVVGGGTGAGLYYLLKFPVKEVVLVDAFGALVEIAKTDIFKPINGGSLNDPRVEVVVEDGYEYLKRTRACEFDLIVFDLPFPEPTEHQVNRFYRREGIELAKRVLSPSGAFSVFAGILPSMPATVAKVKAEVEKRFTSVRVLRPGIVVGLSSSLIHQPLPADLDFDKYALDKVSYMTRRDFPLLPEGAIESMTIEQAVEYDRKMHLRRLYKGRRD